MSTTDQQKSSLLSSASSGRNASSRSAFLNPIIQTQEGLQGVSTKPFLTRSQGEDHTVVQFHRLHHQRYPKDCPPLRVRWFYAVDVPKVVPSFWGGEVNSSKPRGIPKKFVPFSVNDSDAIEKTFQDLAEKEEAAAASPRVAHTPTEDVKSVTVPVNEDFLFDVNIRKRELGPAYWLGPVYEVRRGSWFFQDGSTLKPCEENLAIQLEEGYLKIRPWKIDSTPPKPSNSVSAKDARDSKDPAQSESSASAATASADPSKRQVSASSSTTEPQTYRLFGAYMNNVVNYQDATVAWLVTDDFMSRIGSSVYQKFGGTAGTKLVRGCAEPPKTRESSDTKSQSSAESSRRSSRTQAGSTHDEMARKRKSAPSGSLATPQLPAEREDSDKSSAEMSPFERQMNSLYSRAQNAEEAAEAARAQDERAMDASRETKNDEPGREIDHLILVTHGIGQRLGQRMESINFVHDVNVLRKTLKNVYNAAPDLQALNSDSGNKTRNSRVQVLPICWRHLLDFPRRGIKQRSKELDLADADKPIEEAIYPSLADITLEGVPGVRNLITDLAMDVLLYQSGYREHIANIVASEANRIYKIFKERNPGFKGTVSFCGHSLGSAIMFDILCHQPAGHSNDSDNFYRKRGSREVPLYFEVDSFFCLGSPIALFQMLRGKMIAAEQYNHQKLGPKTTSSRPLGFGNGDSDDDSDYSDGGSISISSPRCKEFYNIFHPSDPISYRLEPLISPAMASLKPQPLPFIKRTIWSTPGQSLTTFSAKVGQSVGSLWSNFTSGVASSLLNRSLGISDEGSQSKVNRSGSPSPGGQKLSSEHRGDSTPGTSTPGDRTDDGAFGSQKIPTLLDTNIETLYDGFQKSRMESLVKKPSDYESTDKWLEAETQARRLRNEDAKVRALNSNGRVDYSIQE
ncbi:hypothetical protein KEM54_001416 [Ascosphaera aggregata]|nr:hypothetical protein KEM54_001416 [Ascosphaera aggregata]